jgi:TatD DNase family protein
MFIDTHCHLFPEYYEDLDSLEKTILDAKVVKVINNGTDNQSNSMVLDLVKKYDYMYGAIGIHPEVVDTYKEDDIDFVEKHLKDNKIVALGEIGLDYYWTKDNKEKQIELFEKQLAIAEKFDIPVIVHSRDATLDTIECLKKYKVRGVIHSFSGSYETAQIYIKMGFLLGINGVVTFKNCNLIDVISRVGIEHFMLETDSPYLTPVPYRGQRNDSSHINDIVNFLSDRLDISREEISKITNDNVKRCFDI